MLRLAVTYCFMLFVCVVAIAAEPEKVDVFQAGKEGYPIYRIPTLVCTGKGTLIAVCEAREKGAGDWAAIDLVYKRSTDGGKTWGPLAVLADRTKYDGPQNPAAAKLRKGGNQITCNNPVLIVDGDAVHGALLRRIRALLLCP
ncbi:MAG: sialidase family protein [Pirellulales bacterium]